MQLRRELRSYPVESGRAEELSLRHCSIDIHVSLILELQHGVTRGATSAGYSRILLEGDAGGLGSVGFSRAGGDR